jgi:hypothetical protein
MVRKLLGIFHKRKLATIGCAVALVVSAAALTSVAMPSPVRADACDKVNIIYCGLDGSGLSGYINSFQSFYENGSNNGYSDLKAVFRWAGATNASVANMNTSNTKVGTLYRNGDVKVDGVLVGHDAWVAARFGAGQPGFVQVTNNSWARKTTTSLQKDTYKLIVHFGADGNADFAVMVICGNAVKFTPVPQPKPQLVCVKLDAALVNNSRTARFTATASAKNTTISKYVFEFGDGLSATVPTSANQTSVFHAYDDFDTNHTVRVTVYGPNFPNGVTSDACVTQFKTSPRGNLICTSLKSIDTDQSRTKKFVATASAVNVTITSYTFTINGDGATTTKTVTTNANTAELLHTFAQENTAFTVSAIIHGTGNDGHAVTSPVCSTQATAPVPQECKPGIPVGSAECNQPQVLADTGAGSIAGVFGITALAGYIGRQFWLRHKLGL